MSHTFVPLISAPAGTPVAQPAGPARLKPIAASPESFAHTTPATHLPQSASANGPAKPAPPSAPPTQNAPPAPPCEPKVTFERQGETITHIRIQCGCGQVMELKCEY